MTIRVDYKRSLLSGMTFLMGLKGGILKGEIH